MKLPSELADDFLAAQFTAATAALTAAGATGIFEHPAPEGAAEPFVTVQMVASVDLSPIGRGVPAIGKLTYQIAAWDAGDRADRVRAIAAAVDAALRDKAPLAVSGGSILSCVPRGEVPAPKTVEGGQAFKRAGQAWEILVEVEP